MTYSALFDIRLDAAFTEHQGIMASDGTEPALRDGDVWIKGKSAIEEYITGCENFFEGWYESRCDLHI